MLSFLNIYIGNLYQTQGHLEEVSRNLPVYGYISNLKGTQRVGLEIEESLVEQIAESAYTRDVIYTVRTLCGIGEFPEEEWRTQLNLSVLACNDIGAVLDVTVKDREQLNSVLDGNANECVVDQLLMEKRGWKTGDSISLNMYYYLFESYGIMKNYPLTICDFRIAGVMESVETNWLFSVIDLLGWRNPLVGCESVEYQSDKAGSV